MLGPIHLCRASFTDTFEEAIAGDRPTGEILIGHGDRRN
jgi:hypothetical protein